MTLVALDVDYRPARVATACVGFAAWTDAAPAFELVARSAAAPAAYAPGRFFERELPYLLEALARLPAAPGLIIVDGYVWLGADRPGLGARLFDALGGRIPVVGVAKRPFRNAPAVPVLRGASRRPLLVTAVGVDPAWAAAGVAAMAGACRRPTLLRRADRLARDA
ncbi:MAG TPA: endonuclease V [Polyangia bacterium]|jgi:deoxyribonuclease V